MSAVDQLLELLRAGKDVIYVDRLSARRRELFRVMGARRFPGELTNDSVGVSRIYAATRGSIEMVETTGRLRGSMVDIVMFADTPTTAEHVAALSAVAVRRGTVLVEVAAA